MSAHATSSKSQFFSFSYTILLWGFIQELCWTMPLSNKHSPRMLWKYSFVLSILRTWTLSWNWFWIMEWNFLKIRHASDFSFVRNIHVVLVWSSTKDIDHIFPEILVMRYGPQISLMDNWKMVRWFVFISMVSVWIIDKFHIGTNLDFYFWIMKEIVLINT